MKFTLLFMLASLALSACAVGMAARTGGVKADEIAQCTTRDCFVSEDKMEVLERNSLPDGGFTETYKFQLKRGSAGRAAMHGLLDVATLGIWEVAGTPIEATKKKKYIVITAEYGPDGTLREKRIGSSPVKGGAVAALPEGTPVTANGVVVGVMTAEGELIPIKQPDQVASAPAAPAAAEPPAAESEETEPATSAPVSDSQD